MYNSYDVHFYGSFVFVVNWPHLQFVVQYDMRDAIFNEIPDKRKSYDGEEFERKKSNTIPHDMGEPGK